MIILHFYLCPQSQPSLIFVIGLLMGEGELLTNTGSSVNLYLTMFSVRFL